MAETGECLSHRATFIPVSLVSQRYGRRVGVFTLTKMNQIGDLATPTAEGDGSYLEFYCQRE